MPEMVTIDQIKDLIKADKIKPSDLFGAESLAGDPTVKGLIDGEKKQASSGEYVHRKRTEEAFDAARTEFNDKIKAKDAELAALKLETARSQIPVLFDKKKTERKLDEKQTKFIEKRLAKFKPEKPEDLEKQLDAFLDGEVAEYGAIAKDVFGIEAVDGGNDGGAGKEKGGEPEGGKKKAPGVNKYVDPAQNPMIKTD